jgi:hypothetical protein
LPGEPAGGVHHRERSEDRGRRGSCLLSVGILVAEVTPVGRLQAVGSWDPGNPVEPEPPILPLDTVPNPPAIRISKPGYRDINDVPPAAIRELLMDSLRQFGSTEEGDLTKEVASQLGFKRTGDRIKLKIGEGVESLIREGKIGREDGRLQVVAPRVNVS